MSAPSNQAPPSEAPRLLSAQRAAKNLGVPYASLRDWALRGHIPIVRVPDCRRLWFDRKDLDRAIAAWKERESE
jgi:predicted site-specific integrase-resolvase